MTETELQAIEARAAKPSPGDVDTSHVYHELARNYPGELDAHFDAYWGRIREEVVELVRESENDVPALVAALRTCKAELDETRTSYVEAAKLLTEALRLLGAKP